MAERFEEHRPPDAAGALLPGSGQSRFTAVALTTWTSGLPQQKMRKNMQKQQHRSSVAIATLAFGAVLAVAASAAVSAAAKTGSDPADTGRLAATTAPAFPTFVHLPADQAAHPEARQEWWYVVGHVDAPGHRFGYEVTIGGGGGYR